MRVNRVGDNDFVCDEKVSARAVIEAQKWSEYYTKFCCQLFSDLPSLNVLHVYYTLTKKNNRANAAAVCWVPCALLESERREFSSRSFFPCRCFAFSSCSIVGQGKIVSYILTFYFIRTTLLLLKTKITRNWSAGSCCCCLGARTCLCSVEKREVLWLCKSQALTPQLSTRTIDSSCCLAWL